MKLVSVNIGSIMVVYINDGSCFIYVHEVICSVYTCLGESIEFVFHGKTIFLI